MLESLRKEDLAVFASVKPRFQKLLFQNVLGESDHHVIEAIMNGAAILRKCTDSCVDVSDSGKT